MESSKPGFPSWLSLNKDNKKKAGRLPMGQPSGLFSVLFHLFERYNLALALRHGSVHKPAHLVGRLLLHFVVMWV